MSGAADLARRPAPPRAAAPDQARGALHGAAPVRALGEAARLLNGGGTVVAQRALAAQLSAPGQRAVGTAPIQRYRRINHARVSDGGDLCLIGKRDLYVADTQLAQANALPGAVAFQKTGTVPPSYLNTHVNDLHLVKPVLKPGFRMDNSDFRTNADRAVSHVTRRGIKEEFDWRNDPANRPGGYNAGNRKKYLRGLHGAEGPLLPTDCGQTSVVVSGHANQPEENESTEMRPGSVYRLMSDHAQAEWPYHYAAVTMTDGADHVTMENAAAKGSKQFSKQPLDKGWWFDMFGPAHGQSFLEKYQQDLPNGTLRRLHPTPPAPAPAPQGGVGRMVSNVLGGIAGVAGGIAGGVSSVAGGIAGGVSRVAGGIAGGVSRVAGGVARGLSALKFWK